MAVVLVVEDGTGKIDANAYISLADADAYHADRFNGCWKGGEDNRNSAILQATEYIDREFLFVGDKTFPENPQALLWPRTGIYDDEAQLLANDEVPLAIQYATAELAMSALTNGELLPVSTTGAVKRSRERVGVIESEQEFDADASAVFYPRVYQMLSPYLAARRLGAGASPLMRG